MAGETTYRAHGFAPQTGGRVHSGLFRVLSHQLEFEADEMKGTFPLAGLQIRRGGHNDEQVFFEHPDFPGWSIYTSDERLAEDPVLCLHPLFTAVLQSAGRTRPALVSPSVAAACVLLPLLALGVGLWLLGDRIASFVANAIPLSWEQKLGEQVFQQIAREGRLLQESPWQKPLEQITGRLQPVVGKSGYTFQFHILNDTNINAFAIPGGHVVILSGLLERAGSPEEVAGVLAHELAHVTRRHSLRNLIKSAGLLLTLQAAFGDVTGLAALAVQGSRHLAQQKFSRDLEREADDTGWNYLLDANIDPRGMLRFFEKLKTSSETSPGAAVDSAFAILSSHPASQERIDRLNALWSEASRKTNFFELGSWPRHH